jgi:hypothetical protein
VLPATSSWSGSSWIRRPSRSPVHDGVATIAGELETDEIGRQMVAAIRHAAQA